jgi:predicted GH43/DUF377 family glycosyl hydrolase
MVAGRIRRLWVGALLVSCVALLGLVAPGTALACSKDDTAYLDSFLDTSCLQLPLTNTTLDALGGLRLAGNGAPSTTSWDTDNDFRNGVSYEGRTFGLVDVATLQLTDTGAAAALTLPNTDMPLTADAANPVVEPTASAALDNDNVDDPTVARTASGFVMWYSGTAEDGSGPAIFAATSADGVNWTRANNGDPVLEGTDGTFDANGVSGPHVIFDAADLLAPFKMWYAGQGDVFGAIGFATSTDGITWVKHDDPATAATADPVLDHGLAGAADSFAAADPYVLKDGATFKMWYTGDDSNKKRIAFATSADGLVWTKGGSVIAPEDEGSNANDEFGAFAPTVFKTAPNAYTMLLGGRKLTNGTLQTKLLSATSADGIAWTAPSPELNPQSSRFDDDNLDSPFVLQDGTGNTAFKLWYSGTALDANGNSHSRIGLATSGNGSSFTRVDGTGTLKSVLDISPLANTEAFDARTASGVSAVVPQSLNSPFVGFYGGNRGFDFKPRIGEVTGPDGSTWTKFAGPGDGGALFQLSNNGFDSGGALDPAALYDQNSGGGNDDWFVYYTAINGAGARSIGRISTTEAPGTLLPNAPWDTRSSALAPNAGFDANAVSEPSVIKDGTTFAMYYAGTDANGVQRIGRATSATAAGAFGGGTQVLTVGPAGTFDHDGVKDPVVVKQDATHFHMLYTGVEKTVDGPVVERIGYATSSNGTTWVKQGVVLSPSQVPFAEDETGVEPTGLVIDGTTLHVYASGIDRTGRARAIHLTTAFPLVAGKVPNGAATYQLGDADTAVQDFRSIVRTSTGTGVTLWMSFLQPYSKAGGEFWSGYFPVTEANATETLNFLQTVRAVRWQARLEDPSGDPSLDKVDIVHAPVSFFGAGSATTLDITPPAGQAIAAWGTLTAEASVFSPGGGGSTPSGTVTVFDPNDPATVLATTAMQTNGDTTLALGSIAPAQHPTLRARFDLTGDASATLLIKSLKVSYNAGAVNVVPPPPPPPPAPVLTLAASKTTLVYGQSAVLSGRVTQGAAGVAGQAVSLLSQPFGVTALGPLGTATTGGDGSYSLTVKPVKTTTYGASFPGATAPAKVKVAVRPLVKLSVVRKGSRGTFSGRISPAHPKRPVTIQLQKGTRWVTFAKLTSSARSTFALKKALKPRTKYRFRAATAADKDHLGGTSAVAFVQRMKVGLAIRLSGRTATFSGAVAPARPAGTVVAIEKLSGTRWVRFAKAKLTSRSTYSLAKKLARGRSTFRARTADDKQYFGGTSVARAVAVR